MTNSSDIIIRLAEKRSKLINRKNEIIKNYNREFDEISKSINEITETLTKIDYLIQQYKCQKCEGTGYIRVCDAAGDMDDETCPSCKGIGIII